MRRVWKRYYSNKIHPGALRHTSARLVHDDLVNGRYCLTEADKAKVKKLFRELSAKKLRVGNKE